MSVPPGAAPGVATPQERMLSVSGRRQDHASGRGLTPGGRIRASEGLAVYGYVQIPVYEKVNESQLAPRVGMIVGVSRSF